LSDPQLLSESIAKKAEICSFAQENQYLIDRLIDKSRFENFKRDYGHLLTESGSKPDDITVIVAQIKLA